MAENKKQKRASISPSKQKKNAQNFVKYWKERGYEKGEGQVFWLTLLRDVYGIKEPEKLIEFESKVKLDNAAFIDGYIDSTKTLIEQKSKGVDLEAKIRHGKEYLTPFEQAKRYVLGLPVSKHPRWIITCNFEEFHVYDMEQPNGLPFIFRLDELPEKAWQLEFIINKDSLLPDPVTDISIKAGDIIGEIYDELLAQYKDPKNPHSLESLNVLCTRLVFLLYAQSAGILGRHNILNAYLEQSTNLRRSLKELFKVLDTPYDERDPYIEEDDPLLAAMPYINGGLFADENIEIPAFTSEIRDLLMKKALEIDFSKISPTIFGAIFESTIAYDKKRSGGMHYTSLENIHKVIDPLFLDDLKEELNKILKSKGSYKKTEDGQRIWKSQAEQLREFQDKLASIIILDPAAGSGNFLTESYIQLRRLENQVIAKLNEDYIAFDIGNPIKVSIGQFYGIEINDFAVSVARTALWIAEAQLLEETKKILQQENIEFFPLKSYPNIAEGNALTMDWSEVVPNKDVTYIIGNPPWVGYYLQNKEQKYDLKTVYVDKKGNPYKKSGEIDYVAGWFFKAAQYIQGTNIRVAFVSTNSITQGEQVAAVWNPLFERFRIHIDFAYTTFIWDSEATMKAHVYCVIIGFSSAPNDKPKMIFGKESSQEAKNISPYLIDAQNVLLENRKDPICNVPRMILGSMAKDGGGFSLTEEERNQMIKKEPLSEQWIHPYIGADEFIKRKKRYCLWLVDADPSELRICKEVMKRVERVKDFRLKSKAPSTRRFGNTPTVFTQIAQPSTNYILVPRTSSENRKYIPMGFLTPDIICSDAAHMIPGASLYHFGVLTSNLHMSWMRAVCGRLEMRYRYSSDIVYNNFPWPEPTPEQKKKIEQTAQAILDIRDRYPKASLADLYDEKTMPAALRKAHEENDAAVMQAYGFRKNLEESEIVSKLMNLYRRFT